MKKNTKIKSQKSSQVSKFLYSLKINESFDTNTRKAVNTKANEITTGMYPFQPSSKPLSKKMLKYI